MMLKLYWTDVTGLPDAELSLLSEYRIGKVTNIKPELNRKCSYGVELLLLYALQREGCALKAALRIETGEYGKPYLANSGFRFNLSHSERYAACAISDTEIGLDVQMRSLCHEGVVQRFFTGREITDIQTGNDPDEAFTTIWCRKESLLKASGLGLRLSLQSFDLGGKNPSADYQDTQYGFRECRRGDLFFCLCAAEDKLPDQLLPEYVSCRELLASIQPDRIHA